MKKIRIGLCVQVGGVILEAVSKHSFGLPDGSPLQSFITSNKPDIRIDVYRDRAIELSDEVQSASFRTPEWILYRRDENYVFRFTRMRNRPVFTTEIACFSPRFDKGTVFSLLPGDPFCPIPHPIVTSVGVVLLQGYLGVRALGLLIHASAVQLNGHVIAFTGPSDAGKSTMAQLWEKAGAKIIADDRVVVRRESHDFLCFGTPYDSVGGRCCPEGAPLRAIFSICHGIENIVKRLRLTEGMMRLVSRSLIPYWIPQGGERGLQFLEDLVRCVPCYDIAFTPDEHGVLACRQVIDYER